MGQLPSVPEDPNQEAEIAAYVAEEAKAPRGNRSIVDGSTTRLRRRAAT